MTFVDKIISETSGYLITDNDNLLAIKWNNLRATNIYLDTFYKENTLLYLPFSHYN
ncbi:hypothetical protein GCM10027192_06080 [Psychrobacter pocilloporae]